MLRRGYTNQVPFRPLRHGIPRHREEQERRRREDELRQAGLECNFPICLRWSWCTWPFLGPWRGTGGGEHRGSWVVSCRQLYFRSIWIETNLWPSGTSSINMPMHGPIGVVFVWAFAWHSSWLKVCFIHMESVAVWTCDQTLDFQRHMLARSERGKSSLQESLILTWSNSPISTAILNLAFVETDDQGHSTKDVETRWKKSNIT